MSNETLTASLENYLEAIFHIVERKRAARPKDIAERMQVSNSSVTGALRALSERGLVNYAPFDIVTLTSEGETAARGVVRRHIALREFFTKVLAIHEGEADEAACQLEHAISPNVLDRLIQFVEFVELCPRAGAEWIRGFGYRCAGGIDIDDCVRCVGDVLTALEPNVKRRDQLARGTLDQLDPGQRAVIRHLAGGAEHLRLAEMGVTPGALIEVVGKAPMGDPLNVRVRGYNLTIRKADAVGISIQHLREHRP